MSNKLKELLERVATWPEQAQEEAVAALEAVEDEYVGLYELSPDDQKALEKSAEDVRTGNIVSESDAKQVLDKYRRA